MKKILIVFLFALVLIAPAISHASVLDDLWAQILVLQQKILVLLKQKQTATSTPAGGGSNCPLYAPVSVDFCKNGTIVPGGTDANGCQLPPKCEMAIGTAGWQTYRNEQYGFQIAIPSNWIVKVYASSAQTRSFFSVGITFSSPAYPNNPIVGIAAYAPEEWDRIQKEDLSETYIGRNNRYVFAYSHILEALPGLEKESDKVERVKNSFKAFDVSSSPQGWQTYRNNQYGFQFEYPRTAKISDMTKVSSGYNSLILNVSVSFNRSYNTWTHKSLDVLVRQGKCDPLYGSFTKIVNSATYEFVDPGITETSGMHSVSKLRTYQTEYNGRCYILTERLSGPGPASESYPRNGMTESPADTNAFIADELQVLDQIVSTFKFTANTQSQTGWQTYRDDIYGIEFKIPPGTWVGGVTPSPSFVVNGVGGKEPALYISDVIKGVSYEQQESELGKEGVENITYTTVGGYRALSYIPSLGEPVEYVVIKDHRIYQFRGNWTGTIVSEPGTGRMGRMIDHFKFTK